MSLRQYPKGTRFNNYFLCKEGDQLFIRRKVVLPDGTKLQPRYPKKNYAHLKTEQELTQLVNRLNHREDEAKKRAIDIRTSFIPTSYMEEFRSQLQMEIPTQKDFRYQYKTVLQSYFLKFFITHLKVLDPNQWYQHQMKWGLSLLGESENPEHNVFGKKKPSFKTISRTIQIANRFMEFLHIKNPKEYQKVSFSPISLGAQKAYTAKRKLGKKKEKLGRFIADEDWKVIEKKLPSNIKPMIMLMYHYGLRRAESLGFKSMENVKKGHLLIEQQLVSITSKKECTYGPVKDRDQRNTPHWFASPKQAYQWISESLNLKIHPDTLSVKWDEFMEELGFDYETHDLRRTFITRALRKVHARDVQLAVGHESLDTTMGYAMDDRDLSDETFDPTA